MTIADFCTVFSAIRFNPNFQRYSHSHYLLKVSLIFLLLFFSISTTFSQTYIVSDSTADCLTPIVLTDTVYGPTNPPKGFGKTQEMSDKLGNLYYFEKEHNTVWFKFTAAETCTLTLDIVPISIKDDYDFLLFKYTGNENNFCQNIKNEILKPVRTAISRNDKSIQSSTGLKEGKTAQFIHSGPGESYSAPLKVTKGDVYYLALDNVYENGSGFTLLLHYKCEKPKKPVLNITLTDKDSGELINGNIDIVDSLKPLDSPASFHVKNVSSYFSPLESLHSYTITASKEGYFPSVITFTAPANSEALTEVITLQKIVAGKHLVLEKIYFYGNQAIFLPESQPALESLLKTMNDNPDLHIQVQGHVNWPYNDVVKADTAYVQNLSNNRAKAVYDYLVQNGISSDRLSYKGFGNRAMVFPYATTEAEMKKNRRVEILVISN